MEPTVRARPLSPHATIYSFRHTMVLSFAHRATGVLLALGLIMLAYWLMAAAGGETSYETAVSFLSNWFCKLVLWGLLVSFTFHCVNGLRHLSWDLVLGMEKHQARLSAAIVLLFALALLVVFTWLLFFRTVAP